MTASASDSSDEPIGEVPVNGELDLHTFRPSDLSVLLPEYVRECRLRGLRQIRIIHGKGTGALRTGVHSLLERLRSKGEVESWQWPAGDGAGGWGATLAVIPPGGVTPSS